MSMYYLAFYSGLTAMLETHAVHYQQLGHYFQMWLSRHDLLDTFTAEEHQCFVDAINMTWDAAQVEMDKRHE